MEPEEKHIKNEIGELARQDRILDDKILVNNISIMLTKMILDAVSNPTTIDINVYARKIVAHIREYIT